jgi:hypothetical protein
MKKHYYIEVILLILLSVAAATLAADNHLYELVWEYTGLDKQQLENSVAVIRLIAFGAIILLSITNIWKNLHSERRMVESLLASVHKVFFKNVNLTDTSQYSIHRITCHKYYPFSWTWTVVGYFIYVFTIFILGRSITHKVLSVSPMGLWVFTILFVTTAFYIFLKVTDAWWYQFWSRVVKIRWRKRKWNRFLRPGRNYCLSYVRYGYEAGELNKVNTTIPFAVDKNTRTSRLFTGKVYDSDAESVISTNHNGINELIKKFNEERKKDQAKYNADNAAFRSYLTAPVSVSIDRLCELQSFKSSLTTSEQERVIKFMRDTNTLAYDLFDINNIGHCEHFLGFQIKGMKNSPPWGVVVIDVLANSAKNFYDYLEFEEDEKWLELFLSSYSELFSQALVPNRDE